MNWLLFNLMVTTETWLSILSVGTVLTTGLFLSFHTQQSPMQRTHIAMPIKMLRLLNLYIIWYKTCTIVHHQLLPACLYVFLMTPLRVKVFSAPDGHEIWYRTMIRSRFFWCLYIHVHMSYSRKSRTPFFQIWYFFVTEGKWQQISFIVYWFIALTTLYRYFLQIELPYRFHETTKWDL